MTSIYRPPSPSTSDGSTASSTGLLRQRSNSSELPVAKRGRALHSHTVKVDAWRASLQLGQAAQVSTAVASGPSSPINATRHAYPSPPVSDPSPPHSVELVATCDSSEDGDLKEQAGVPEAAATVAADRLRHSQAREAQPASHIKENLVSGLVGKQSPYPDSSV